MGKRGQRYSQEFKDSTIQLALNSEKSMKGIAEDLGVHYKTLTAWLLEYKRSNNLENSFTTGKTQSTSKESLEEENRRLRKELSDVKKDREILKKAAAYFAKEAL